MRTQVCIIGGGPSGLLLSQILHRNGIESIVIERRSRDYVLSRIRAGVLEWGSVETLRAAGVGARMDREGFVHDGIRLSFRNRDFRVDLQKHGGRSVMLYGQTEITHDLYDQRDRMGGTVIHEVEDVSIDGANGTNPCVSFVKNGMRHGISCDFVAGCDGFHGISRKTIPASVLREYERVYPFGWLGMLSETPPVSQEVVYANHERGFALCSMRTEHLSRYYIQTEASDRADNWSDDAFWDEFRRRLPPELAESLVTGPSVEKSVAPLRSFVAEPMRWGRLFLVGDAAHIVPPTGAKGLNLAIGDVHYLSRALIDHYRGDDRGIDAYSQTALARVWKTIRFSWALTGLFHRFPDQTDFEQRIQDAELAHLETSDAAQSCFAEQYVGVPY